MSTPLITILIAGGFVAYAVYQTWKTISTARRISASHAWSTLAAEVIDKQVASHHNRRSGRTYFPEITYRYSVMGQQFEVSTRLPGMWSRRKAEEAVANFGSTINLRYNPDDVGDHVLENARVNMWDVALIVFAVVIALIVLAPLIM